jgi:hypothetical protein
MPEPTCSCDAPSFAAVDLFGPEAVWDGRCRRCGRYVALLESDPDEAEGEAET